MISVRICSSFKAELLRGIHDLGADTIRCALYNGNATLSEATTAYTPTDEVSGPGYVIGGSVATVSAGFPAVVGTAGACQLDDIVWPSATFSAKSALIYNASKEGRAIAVIDFSAEHAVTNSSFTIQFPAHAPALLAIN